MSPFFALMLNGQPSGVILATRGLVNAGPGPGRCADCPAISVVFGAAFRSVPARPELSRHRRSTIDSGGLQHRHGRRRPDRPGLADGRLNANPRVDEAHHRVSPAGFKYYVNEMLCQAAGGPQQYSGRSMEDSHRHLEITEEEWGAFMDDVQQTLNRFDVPPPEQEEVKAIVESTHDAIVVSPLQSATPRSRSPSGRSPAASGRVPATTRTRHAAHRWPTTTGRTDGVALDTS